MALFTKSYADLSAAFVETMFAESQTFGRPDIEQWLASQRLVIQPDVPMWTSIVKRRDFLETFPADALAVIRENADYATDMPSFSRVSNPAPALWGVAEALYRMLPLDQVKVYRGERHVVFDNGTDLPVVLVEYDDDRGSCHAGEFVSGWGAGDILLYTWKKGGGRSLRARLYLCDFFGALVGGLRQKVQSDFDRAVAVSADGKQVVQATEVWVFDSEIVRRYPPESFFTSKILRSPCMGRFDRGDDIDRVVQQRIKVQRYSSGDTLCDQTLFVSHDGKRKIFATHRDYCPDPLPAPLPEPAKA